MKKILLFILIVFASAAKQSPCFAQAPSFEWAKRIGGAVNNHSTSMAVDVDGSGNVYTTGYFSGTVDFDPGPGVFNLTATSGWDIFISKLDSSGNFIWAKRMGGSGNAGGNAIAVDAAGNVYTTGNFLDVVDFDPGPGIFNLFTTISTHANIFISKLDSSGNFVWAKQMEDTQVVDANAISIDSFANVYTTGWFEGTADFDPGVGTYNITSAGVLSTFISKLDSSGNFIWAKAFGASGGDATPLAMTVDVFGNVFTTGYFNGIIDFDPNAGAFGLMSSGGEDIFISKLDSSGNFAWAKKIGGGGNERGRSIAVDANGNVYTTGYFSGTVDFNPSTGTFNMTSNGGNDIFILKLDSSGNFNWAKRMGGTQNDIGEAIRTNALGYVYIAGEFTGTVDFDPNSGTFNLFSNGLSDIFISKISALGNFVWAKDVGGGGNDFVHYLTLNVSGIGYLTGAFSSQSIIFDSDTLINTVTGGTISDIFIAKLEPCFAHFTIFPDTIPHNWIALNQSYGVPPINYTWSWGDSTTSTGPAPSHTYSDSGYYNICLTINDAVGCISTYCDSSTFIYRGNTALTLVTINVIDSTGPVILHASEIEKQNTLLLYPNPFSNEINIKGTSKKGEVIIYDLTGREIYRQKTFDTETILNTGFISSGFYLLKYVEENKTANFKVMKF